MELMPTLTINLTYLISSAGMLFQLLRPSDTIHSLFAVSWRPSTIFGLYAPKMTHVGEDFGPFGLCWWGFWPIWPFLQISTYAEIKLVLCVLRLSSIKVFSLSFSVKHVSNICTNIFFNNAEKIVGSMHVIGVGWCSRWIPMDLLDVLHTKTM